jgi:hypothetical protein
LGSAASYVFDKALLLFQAQRATTGIEVVVGGQGTGLI